MPEEVFGIEITVEPLEDWRTPFLDFLEWECLADSPTKRIEIRRWSTKFVVLKGLPYQRSLDGILLRCIACTGIHEALSEVHSSICGAHQSGPKLYMQIKRLGYYWPTMIYDCMEFTKRCQACQYHEKFIRLPPESLHTTGHSWPFITWGIDIVDREGYGPRIQLYFGCQGLFLQMSGEWRTSFPPRSQSSSESILYIDSGYRKRSRLIMANLLKAWRYSSCMISIELKGIIPQDITYQPTGWQKPLTRLLHCTRKNGG